LVDLERFAVRSSGFGLAAYEKSVECQVKSATDFHGFDRSETGSILIKSTTMNKTPLTTIAPEVFRKRLLVEGYFGVEINEDVIRKYFERMTSELGLRTYGDPIIHKTSGQGKELNEGYDGFVPLIDSGIYAAAWVNAKFLSTIIYTCGEFDEEKAVAVVKEFFDINEIQAAIF
jgi:hypothetical protein